MSVEKRVTFNDYDEPVVTITITGYDDAFRFGWALAHLQCESADLGRRIGGSLKRKLGAGEFRRLHAHFTSNKRLTWARERYNADPDSVLVADFVREADARAMQMGDFDAYHSARHALVMAFADQHDFDGRAMAEVRYRVCGCRTDEPCDEDKHRRNREAAYDAQCWALHDHASDGSQEGTDGP